MAPLASSTVHLMLNSGAAEGFPVRYAVTRTGEKPVPFHADPPSSTMLRGSVTAKDSIVVGEPQVAVTIVVDQTTLHPSETRTATPKLPIKEGLRDAFPPMP